MERYPYSRIAVLYVQNDTIGDGVFVRELAATLREYADMIERNEAGREACEKYDGPRGTKLTVIGAAWNGDRIPCAAQDLRRHHDFDQPATG